MIDADIIKLAEATVGAMPAHISHPSKYLNDRKAAAAELAIWVSRAAVFANALLALQRQAGDLEYESWA